MPFSALVGNETVKRLLRRAVETGRIGQGLIMAGPRGVGKHLFAMSLAQALNCEAPREGDGCGECIPCRRIERKEHLDVRTITRDGAFIKVDQMREMSADAQYRPYEGRRRVYIIDDAHRLNQQASNSILKTLEEPPETTLIVLVTPKPYALLETIRSRCQMLSFAPIHPADLATYVQKQRTCSAEDAAVLARLSQGSIGRALEIDLDKYKSMRVAAIGLLESLAVSPDRVRLLKAAEYYGRKLERDDFEQHMDVLMVVLEDILYLKEGRPAESLTNADIASRLELITESLPREQMISLADRIEQMIQSLVRNVNRQLAMESLLFDFRF